MTDIKFLEIEGYYGIGNLISPIFVGHKANGTSWYCVKDSVNVNLTSEADKLQNGINIETLSDIDVFTTKKPIRNLWQFKRRVLE